MCYKNMLNLSAVYLSTSQSKPLILKAAKLVHLVEHILNTLKSFPLNPAEHPLYGLCFSQKQCFLLLFF